MTADYHKTIQFADHHFQQCVNLPFPVFLVSLDGTFLKYNEECRILFDLPQVVSFQDTISAYYIHPSDREQHLERLHDMPSGQWLKSTVIDLKIGANAKHVWDYSLAIWDDATHQIMGLVCLMIPLTKNQRYDRLFADLQVGIFNIREGRGLVHANNRFAQMHGYSSLEEMKDVPLNEFFCKSEDLEQIIEQLKESGHVFNRIQEHQTKNGGQFTGSMSARAVYNASGQFAGMEGILDDVTTEALYFKLVNEVPIGLYRIEINRNEEHILKHCNTRFANNRGAETPEDLIGKDMRQFYHSDEEMRRFEEELIHKNEIIDYWITAYNGKGEVRQYEVHAKSLKNTAGRFIGHLGAEKDITDYLETRQQLQELTTDIGKVLHSYSSTLINAKQAMDAVIRSFSGKSLKISGKEKLDENKISAQLHGSIAGLRQSLEKIGHQLDTESDDTNTFSAELMRLLSLIEGKGEKQEIPNIRNATIRIREMVGEQASIGNFSREWVKDIRNHLREILRLCSLITLQRSVDTVLEMESSVHNLRSYILSPVKKKTGIQRIDLYELVGAVLKVLEEYATSRGIEVRLNIRAIKNSYINGDEEDLMRALLNIVHNAIKYSWTRKEPAKAFVSVNANLQQEWVQLEVENWGVGITPEELEQGLIYQVGYRGIHSSDKRRPGTGLGLYDSKKVIEKHGGILQISSTPTLGNLKNDFSSPFVTKVLIQLPRN
ncbi:MAG TPA: PAS domain-containing protein [Saprospiraceae bacterium]|nr:PAS domain-containing protein [Saprospiraceae bacterium]HMQ84703.1 PAS domain-containing protein [Saprospiraceae bacterium]